MHHLVRFTTPDGQDSHHLAPTLEEAVRHAEQVRNGEGASGVTLFRLTAVPIEFRTYYRVEVTDDHPVDGVTASGPAPADSAHLPAQVVPVLAETPPPTAVPAPMPTRVVAQAPAGPVVPAAGSEDLGHALSRATVAAAVAQVVPVEETSPRGLFTRS